MVMSPDARRSAEDPCAEGLEPSREGGDRVTDDAAVSPIVDVGPPPFERQGRGRVFHMNLVALRHQRFGQVAHMVRVPSEVIRWIEGRGHDEFEGLHSSRPSGHGVVKPCETIGVVALERPHSPRDLTLHRKILTPSSWKEKERTWTYNLYVSQRRGSETGGPGNAMRCISAGRRRLADRRVDLRHGFEGPPKSRWKTSHEIEPRSERAQRVERSRGYHEVARLVGRQRVRDRGPGRCGEDDDRPGHHGSARSGGRPGGGPRE